MSKHRKVRGIPNIPATYATNFAIVAACYCGIMPALPLSSLLFLISLNF